jgi:outer membrane protein TolC
MIRLSQTLAVFLVVGGGCVTAPRPQPAVNPAGPTAAAQVERLPAPQAEVQLASHTPLVGAIVAQPVMQAVQITAAETQGEPEILPPGSIDGLSPADTLDESRLVAEVLARNPSVQAMIAAWEAAAERYPQDVALDDPMLDVNVGPGSWGSSDVKSAYMVMVSQKFPWPGKRQMRGAVADSQASGAASQIDDIQLRLAEMTRLAYYDYFAASRELALNGDNLREMREFRETAAAKLRASLVTQQDVLQADVELALLERRRNELARQTRVAAARINTLLHRDAAYPLPPPPSELAASKPVPSLDELRILATQRRPDVAALAAQIQADDTTLALAYREFYPDLELYAKYDAFWQEDPLRTAVGVNVNLPLNKSRRCAAVREAQSRLRQHRAEYERLVDEIANDLHASYERLAESRRTLQLFADRIIPAAGLNVQSARAGYTAGKVDFLRLIESQRQFIALREQQVETLSDYHRRLAELERTAAMPIVTP